MCDQVCGKGPDLCENDELVKQELYLNDCEDGKTQKTLRKIELAIDIIYMIEILLNFVKKTRAHKELKSISYNYITGYFIFDVVATVPGFFYE
jgi:hypothetical protein